jgi:hypothetical protein
MTNIKQRFNLRISDRLAVSVALVLCLTAAGTMLEERAEPSMNMAPSTAMPAKSEAIEPVVEDSAKPSGLNARFSLFRQG